MHKETTETPRDKKMVRNILIGATTIVAAIIIATIIIIINLPMVYGIVTSIFSVLALWGINLFFRFIRRFITAVFFSIIIATITLILTSSMKCAFVVSTIFVFIMLMINYIFELIEFFSDFCDKGEQNENKE